MLPDFKALGKELDEAGRTPIPQNFDSFRAEIDRCIKKGDIKGAQKFYDRMQRLRRGLFLSREAETALTPIGTGAISLVRAYARSGEIDKARKIIQEMENVRDSSGRPAVSISILKLMLENKM